MPLLTNEIAAKQYLQHAAFVKPSVGANVRTAPGTDKPIARKLPKGAYLGEIVGYQLLSDGIWFSVQENFVSAPLWVRSDVINLPDALPDSSSQVPPDEKTLLHSLIASDQEVYKELLILAEQIDRLERKGVNVTAYVSKYNRIREDYNERQGELRTYAQIQVVQDYAYAPIEWLKRKWSGVSGAPRVSAAPAVLVAIGAVAGLILGGVLYLLIRPKYDTSRKNLKESKELRAALDKVDPKVAQNIRADLEDQIDDAYNTGKEHGVFSALGNVAKIGLFVFLGFKGAEYIGKKKKK